MATTLDASRLVLKSGTSWNEAWHRCVTVAPEAFRDDRVLNLWGAAWQADGRVLPATSPVDGSPIAGPPRLDAATAQQAVRASLDQHRAWRHIPLDERRARGRRLSTRSPNIGNCSHERGSRRPGCPAAARA